MKTRLIILLVSFAVYIPLAGTLLYVWWKHGKGERGVSIARNIFLIGSALLFMYMLVL